MPQPADQAFDSEWPQIKQLIAVFGIDEEVARRIFAAGYASGRLVGTKELLETLRDSIVV